MGMLLEESCNIKKNSPPAYLPHKLFTSKSLPNEDELESVGAE